MRPSPERSLRGVAMSLMVEVAPAVATPFGQFTSGLAGSIAMYVAAEIDGLANRMLEENKAIVALARDAVPVLGEGPLTERLLAAGDELDTPDIRISTLQEANDRLRTLLIDLHVAVENTEGEAARDMESRIWNELVESTARRHVEPLV